MKVKACQALDEVRKSQKLGILIVAPCTRAKNVHNHGALVSFLLDFTCLCNPSGLHILAILSEGSVLRSIYPSEVMHLRSKESNQCTPGAI